MNHICQGCGKEIVADEIAVLVSYGNISKRGNFYCRKGIDVFHEKCEKAFRNEV